MDIKTEIREIIEQVVKGNYTEEEATEHIFALFDVVGLREQLVLFAGWLDYNGKHMTGEEQVRQFLKGQN